MQFYVWIVQPTLEDAARLLEVVCARLERIAQIERADVTQTKLAENFLAFLQIDGRRGTTYRRIGVALDTFVGSGITKVDASRTDDLYDAERWNREIERAKAETLALVPDVMKEALREAGLLDALVARVDTDVGKYVAWIVTAPNGCERRKRIAQMLGEVEGGTHMFGKLRSPRIRLLIGQPGFVVRGIADGGHLRAFRRRPKRERDAYLAWIASAKTERAQRKRLARMLEELEQDLFMGKLRPIDPRYPPRGYRVR